MDCAEAVCAANNTTKAANKFDTILIVSPMTVCPVFAVEFDGKCGIRAGTLQGGGDRLRPSAHFGFDRRMEEGKGRPSSQLDMWRRTPLLQDPHHPVEPPPKPEPTGVRHECIAVPVGVPRRAEE